MNNKLYSGFGNDNDTLMYNEQDMAMSSDERMRLVAEFMAKIIFPLILFVGISGNLVSMVIMEKLSREVSSTCSYLAVVAIVDSVVLSISCGNGWLEKTLKRNVAYTLMVHSLSVCKVLPFIFNFLFHLSRWLLVAMTIEGFLAMKYPSRAAHLCTLQRAKAVALLLTVLLVCINVHFFWSFEVVMQVPYGMPQLVCGFSQFKKQGSEDFENVVWPLIDLLVGELLPVVIIVGCVISMAILKHKGLHKGPPSHQKWRQRYTMDPMAQDQLKFVFLYVGVLHVVFMLPSFIFIIIRFVNEKQGVQPNEVVVELVGTICHTLQYVGSSSKLCVYIFVSPRFRREVKHRFQCCYKLCDPTQLHKPFFMKKSASATSNSRWRSMDGADLESPIITRHPASLQQA